MPDNIFGSNIPDGLTLSPSANSSDDKYVQGSSPHRSSATSNPSDIFKSGFYYGTIGTIKNVMHSQAADGSAYQIVHDSGSGVYMRTKSSGVWSTNKYLVTRDGDQYIQNITTDSITALKIPLSTSTVTTASTDGIRFKSNTNAPLTQSLAVRAVFTPSNVNSEYISAGYAVQMLAPSQSDKSGMLELNEDGKLWTSYSGWFHRNYINKTNATTGTYTVDAPNGDAAIRIRGDGLGWGASLEIEGVGNSSDWTAGTGASISYHKPGVIRWKQGIAVGSGEIWGTTEWQVRAGFVPGTTNGQLNYALSDTGRGWYRSGIVALCRSNQDVPINADLEGNKFYGKVIRLTAGGVDGSGAQIHYLKPGQVEWGVGIKHGIGGAAEGNNFVFQSGGSSTQNGSQTAMIEYSTGRLWTQAYGWLDKKFFNGSSRIQPDWFNVGPSNYIEIKVDGVAKGISFFNSDKRLKKNIKNTTVDSLGLVNQIEFKSFDYKDDQYESKTNGVIAQQLEKINKEWVNTMSDGAKMPDTNDLLVSALHAIQQLNKKVEELEKKLENK